MIRFLRLLAFIVLGSCTDVPMPYELDHARIMAVKVDPPSLAPGERARIEVLATDADGGPRVVLPSSVTSPAPLPIGRDDAGWYVDAPITTATAVVPLSLVVEVGGESLTADKTIALGAHADNPSAPVILQKGAALDRAAMTGTDEVVFDVASPDAALSYRWFSSVGDLTGYTRAQVTLEPEPGTQGMFGVVVRDQAGGAAWTLIPAEVAP